MRLAAIFPLLYLMWVLSANAYGQNRANIELGKSASALVELPNKGGYATAFCIKSSGVFVTNRHVVKDLKVGDSIKLVVEPSLKSERIVQSILVRVDPESDLAILRVTKPSEFSMLRIGSSDSLFESTQLTAFGYPFGVLLAVQKDAYPSISVNQGRVTSLRRDLGEIQLIQLDAILNPGNSGGPIINEAGEVVGITSFGMRSAAGVNFAVPSNHLKRLLTEPIVQVNVPSLTDSNFPKVVEADVSPFEGDLIEPTVEFFLTRGEALPQVFPMQPKDGNRYEVILDAKALGRDLGNWIKGKFEFEKGRIETQILNDQISTDEGPVLMSEVSSMQVDDPSKPDVILMILRNGQTRVLSKSTLPKIKIDFGDYPGNLMLSKVTSMQLDELEEVQLDYSIVVKSKGAEIFRKSKDKLPSLKLPSANSMNDLAAKEFANMEQNGPITVLPKMMDARILRPKGMLKIEDKISNVHLAGGGEFLVVCRAESKKVTVVSLVQGTFHGEISLRTEKALVTATKQHIVVADPTAGTIECISLASLKRESMVKLNVQGRIKAISAGYGSQGPLLVSVETETGDKRRSSLVCVDLKPLRIVPMKTMGEDHFVFGNANDTVEMRSSYDGRVYGMWYPSTFPSGVQSVTIHNDTLHFGFQHESPGFALPSADGSHLLTGLLGTLPSDLSMFTASTIVPGSIVPTSHPRLFFVVNGSGEKTDSKQAEIHLGSIGSEETIRHLPEVSVPLFDLKARANLPYEIPIDKRLFFLVEQSLIVTIPDSNDRVVWQSCNLRNEMRTYFFVSSAPPKVFRPGEPFAYKLRVETSEKRLSFKLLNGPPGMQMSTDGLISWDVPTVSSDDKVSVSVLISNDRNQIRDTFSLRKLATP